MSHILALDQGTTSSRAIVFDADAVQVSVAQREFAQHFPADGWVEHDADDIFDSTLAVARDAIVQAGLTVSEIAAIGITNQRETTLVWDRRTGQPVHRAIVWQDRRTAEYCDRLEGEGFGDAVTASTGLLLDPYFSATKVAWLLDNVDGCRAAAERGELAFGTVDTWLMWRLTGGRVHRTDATNASRTMLFNIHTQTWDDALLTKLRIPRSMLPEVLDCAADFGVTDAGVFGAEIPICGVAGDQQAALVGQCCFEPGMIKSTYGTGCFVITNTGSEALQSANRLLTTVGYRLDGQVTYGLEGSIFNAGTAIQWLRDGLKLFADSAETEALARAADPGSGTYVVPAFTGLGAPYWDAGARGAIVGLTRDTGIDEVVAATLQSVCYQTRDLLVAMRADGVAPSALRVDGGMVANEWMLQFLSDALQMRVERPAFAESTALGACYLAGLQAGMFESTAQLAERWTSDRRVDAVMPAVKSDALYAGWQEAVGRVRSDA